MSSYTEKNYDIGQILAAIYLDRYHPVFQKCGYHTVLDCAKLNHEMLQEIGISLTGHRKRILKKIQSLLLKGLKEPGHPESSPTEIEEEAGGILFLESADFTTHNLNSLYATKLPEELPENPVLELGSVGAGCCTGEAYYRTHQYFNPEDSNDPIQRVQHPLNPFVELATWSCVNHPDRHEVSLGNEEQLDSQKSSFFVFQGNMVENEIYDEITDHVHKFQTKVTPSRSFILRNRPVPQLPLSVDGTFYKSPQETRSAATFSVPPYKGNPIVNIQNSESSLEESAEKGNPISPYEETFFFSNSELKKETSGDNFPLTKDHERNEEDLKSNACTLDDSPSKTPPKHASVHVDLTSEESVYSTVEECTSKIGVNKTKDLKSQSFPSSSTQNKNVSHKMEGPIYENTNDSLSISPYACFYGPSTVTSKLGWLDKLSPHRSGMFQKRWVKCDGHNISYYHNDRDVYSQGIISLSAITNIQMLGESKFAILTSQRTFVFRVEKEGDRHDWISTLQLALKSQSNISPTLSLSDKSGYLQLRGYKNKIFTMINGSKLWLSKSNQDANAGITITYIMMTMATIKSIDRKCFEIITPYRTFCFTAESEREKQEWIEAVQQSIAETLSDYEVAEKIWFNESNRSCADCRAPNPDWASINLGVVVCKNCAGQHRSLGSNISKVHSLKLDSSIWSNELVELFIVVGNEKVNSFWEANVFPDNMLDMDSTVNQRILFITQKYKEGRFRKTYSPCLSKPQLNEALCAAVITPDVLETMILVFSGADIMCTTEDLIYSTPYLLAKMAGQCLQMEFLHHNRFSDYKCHDYHTEIGTSPNSFYCGFLYKASSSSSKLSTNKKLQEDMKKWWCTLEDSFLHYYESESSSTPNGVIDLSEGTCLVVHPSDSALNFGAIFTFEIYLLSERMFLFGAENVESQREWTRAIAKNFVPTVEEYLVELHFNVIGHLYYKDSCSQWKESWFALDKAYLHFCHKQENVHGDFVQLKKLQELTTSSSMLDGEKRNILLLVENGRTLYIHGHTILDFMVWHSAIEKAAGTDGNALQDQQLSKNDIPIIVNSCIAFVTQYGLGSKSLYLKNGNPLHVRELLEDFKKDARSIKLRAGKHQLEDVTDVLKCFLYEIDDALLTKELYPYWISALVIQDEKERIKQYETIIDTLPAFNKTTLAALIQHLYRVQKCSNINHLDAHILASAFSSCLFQTQGHNNEEVCVVEDLIIHYVKILHVSAEQVQQMDRENCFITKWKDIQISQSGDLLLEVYLERKVPDMCVIIRVSSTMEAEELTMCAAGIKNITPTKEMIWTTFEVIENGELERPMLYKEKVLKTVLEWGLLSDPGAAYLLVKPFCTADMISQLSRKPLHHMQSGYLKCKEDPSKLLTGNKFQERYVVLRERHLLLYKDMKIGMAWDQVTGFGDSSETLQLELTHEVDQDPKEQGD
ncbi:arf-GAP with Rho-GAP domain, ANK repeat and PH domain-containing protein 2 isoform X2 [Ascaphus truei]|uniref:arf-GAP with Rho-GAP domain, ANK repeat and PH domain-containing protein 2 isoform X2 n=1 Tax=Ascaphus truei TaxID=8439 RepID=UPI003F59280C